MGTPTIPILVNEGRAIVQGLDLDSPTFFADLDQLRDIIKKLDGGRPLVDSGEHLTEAFSLSDKAASAQALRSYFDELSARLPSDLAAQEASTVRELALMVGATNLVNDARNISFDEFQSNAQNTCLSVFATLAARGFAHDMDIAKLADNVKTGEDLLKQELRDHPDFVEAVANYNNIIKERRTKLKALNAQIDEIRHLLNQGDTSNNQADGLAKLKSLEEEYQSVYADNDEIVAWNKVTATYKKLDTERQTTYNTLYEDSGRQVIDKLLAASPITDEAARSWASAQVIDDNARSKLRRLGYKPEDAVRDMAEFYRLTGGKVSAVRIAVGGRRASTSNIETRLDEKVINLGMRFNRSVLFHELAHHLESDPIAKAASAGFLLKRRESDKLYRLREMTTCDYRPSELAYKDSFTDPYIGKYYSDGLTEVFSMGVQYLANPVDAARFAGKDPEMFNMITGYLSMPVTPAMRAKLNMHKGVISENQDKAASEAEQYDQAIAKLAGKSPITADDWYAALDSRGKTADSLWMLYHAKKRDSNLVYIGSSGSYKVFSGVFKNPATRRYGKGHFIINIESLTAGYPDYAPIPGGLEAAKAAITITQERKSQGMSGGLSSGAYNYLNPDFSTDAMKRTIQIAQELQ